MANDPNRDILPVKEDCSRTGKVTSEKFDHQILGKLTRCELEDRFLRLLDEQTHIKKLANCQEEKIKRLGTKLLRLINEKKSGKKYAEHGKETEDLHLRVVELEHENYALKDKNTVLKQQLASHSRHISSHRSPVRSNHTSPLMSMRQSAGPVQSEIVYGATNKNGMAEVQLQEAETHIRELNEEIKSLHNKIDYLQQNLEKSSLDSRKVKVTENIELIRLQRSLKQQAIQIAALQAQVKNSENNQKVLKEELVRAHKENDEALHLISDKQNEILNLYSKLEEKNLNRLEEDELKERIHDLKLERDCLKERSDFLMKTIGAKAEESEKINELKQLLAEEKRKKEKLEEALEATKRCVPSSPIRRCTCEVSRTENSKPAESDSRFETQQVQPQSQSQSQSQPSDTKEVVDSIGDNSEESESSFIKNKHCCCQENCPNLEPESDTESRETSDGKAEASSHLEGKYAAEKMKLERELQYLREMLRSQTCRCEAQQVEISRLMYELKLNEDKCNETLQRLDMHLTIFEQLEMRSRQNDRSAGEPVRLRNELAPITQKSETRSGNKEVFQSKEISRSSSNEKKFVFNGKARRLSSDGALALQLGSKEQLSRTPRISLPQVAAEKVIEQEPKKRFVDQVFLDSSDEDLGKEEKFEKEPFLQKLLNEDKEERSATSPDMEKNRIKSMIGSINKNIHRGFTSGSLSSKHDSSFQIHSDVQRDSRKDQQLKSSGKESSNGEVTISILWLQMDPEGSLWKNDNVRFFFVDFSFLDVNGEETETPDSLLKPSDPKERCYFNYSNVVQIHRGRREILKSMLNKPDMDLIIFKVVSDSENLNETNFDCEDIGVAVVNVKMFLEHCNKDPFLIPVKNPENMNEMIGTLAVKIEATSSVFSF